MVEARGVEPLSENLVIGASPSAVLDLKFPLPSAQGQAHGVGSFMSADLRQSLGRSVPRLNDAGDLGRGRSKADESP